MSDPISVIATIILLWIFIMFIAVTFLVGFGLFVYRIHASRVNTQSHKPQEE